MGYVNDLQVLLLMSISTSEHYQCNCVVDCCLRQHNHLELGLPYIYDFDINTPGIRAMALPLRKSPSIRLIIHTSPNLIGSLPAEVAIHKEINDILHDLMGMILDFVATLSFWEHNSVPKAWTLLPPRRVSKSYPPYAATKSCCTAMRIPA